jgi:ribosomal protein S18 acetylase RimI-like enzyme
MKLIASTLKDIPAIMKIIADAQCYLAELGIDQWQDGYPNEEQIILDIKNQDSYLIINNEGVTIGTTVFTFKEESTYQQIEGEWITSETAKYGVIHRLAVDNKYRGLGLAKFVFDTCEEMVEQHAAAKSLRIDTHRQNLGMQGLLRKRNYNYCGVIYLDSGDDRLAFEKVINK